MLKEDTDQFVIKKLYIFVHVCLCPINVKTAKSIGPNTFVWDLT